jgi:hypothetical protein
MRHCDSPNDQLAVTTETLLGVATPWMVVCVPEPVPAELPLPPGAVTVSFDLAHPVNRPATAIRQAMPLVLTRSFLNMICGTFSLCDALELLRHGVRAITGSARERVGATYERSARP